MQPETPEFAMARKWRQLEEEGQNQKATLEKQLEEDQHKMEFDFEAALRDQESEYIRQGNLFIKEIYSCGMHLFIYFFGKVDKGGQ